MELRHLRYFVAVAEELNFRRAGDRLHVSHPALSKQIGDLEYSLGVKLLLRDTGSVRLTSAGRIFLKDVRKLLAQTSAVVTNVQRHAREHDTITVGDPGPIGVEAIYKALAAFRKEHPHVTLRMVEIPLMDQPAALLRGKIQLCFATESQMSRNPKIEKKLLFSSSLVVVLGKENPLARKTSLTCADISKETFLCVGSAKNTGHLEPTRLMMPPKMRKNINFKFISSIPELMLSLTSGEGITIMPGEITALPKDLVVFRKLTDSHAKLNFELWAFWKKQTPAPALSELIAML